MSYLDHLRSFVAVHRLSSITGAARLLGLTQPAVTGHIKALETQLGRPLFERAGRGIVPTAAADALAQQIAPHVDALEGSLSTAAAQGDEIRGALAIGGPAEFMTEVALPVLAEAAGQGITIHTRFGLARDLIGQLEAKELDLVVAAQRIPRPAVAYEALFSESFILAGAPKFHHLAPPGTGIEALAAALETVPWVAYASSLPIIRRFFRVSLGHEPRLAMVSTVPDLRAVRVMLEAGAGLSVLPDYLCADAIVAGRLVEIWRPERVASNTLWIATQQGSRSRRTTIVVDLLRRLSNRKV